LGPLGSFPSEGSRGDGRNLYLFICLLAVGAIFQPLHDSPEVELAQAADRNHFIRFQSQALRPLGRSEQVFFGESRDLPVLQARGIVGN
jgi:hypothetical protein